MDIYAQIQSELQDWPSVVVPALAIIAAAKAIVFVAKRGARQLLALLRGD